MSGLLPARVSQEAFDEVVKENMEDFELSPSAAVADAIAQFNTQNVNLDNLDLSVPTDEARAVRSKYLAHCALLDDCITSSGTVDLSQISVTVEEVCDALKSIIHHCSPDFHNARIFRSLLSTGAGIYTLMSFLGVEGGKEKEVLTVLTLTVDTLKVVTKESMELRDAFIAQDRCSKLILAHMANPDVVANLLGLLKISCKAVENNKGYFMKAGGAKCVLTALKKHKEHGLVLGEACFLVGTLCKFDDFRKEMSGAHDNAKDFHSLGIIPALLDITRFSLTSGMTKVAAAAMSATRVLAVNDEIVQSLVASGLLDLTQTTLSKYLSSALLVAAAIGVFRNVSGNDEIKSTLCTNGSLNQMLIAMRQHMDSPSIAEHGCGTLAAMALRKPENVQHIMDCDGANTLVVAMKRHPTHVLVQRQGCLAIRNMIARTPEHGEALLELGVEKVLKDAGQHQGAVDEAYAALRDLGCEAGIVKFDETGEQIKSQVFGESKPNFNPTVRETCDIDQRVEDNQRPANQSVRF